MLLELPSNYGYSCDKAHLQNSPIHPFIYFQYLVESVLESIPSCTGQKAVRHLGLSELLDFQFALVPIHQVRSAGRALYHFIHNRMKDNGMAMCRHMWVRFPNWIVAIIVISCGGNALKQNRKIPLSRSTHNTDESHNEWDSFCLVWIMTSDQLYYLSACTVLEGSSLRFITAKDRDGGGLVCWVWRVSLTDDNIYQQQEVNYSNLAVRWKHIC